MYIAGRDWFLLVKNEDKIQFKTKIELPSITSHAWYNSQAHDHKQKTLTGNWQNVPKKLDSKIWAISKTRNTKTGEPRIKETIRQIFSYKRKSSKY